MGTTQLVKPEESLQELQQRLGELKAKAEMSVVDQKTFISSAAVKLDLEAYIRAVNDHFEPELAPAEETVKRVKLAIAGLVTQPKQWLADLVARRKAYAEEERRAAEREQQRIRAEAEAKARQKAEEERREADRIAKEQREAREKELEAQRKAGEINKREQERMAKQAREDEEKARQLAAKQAEETAKAVPEVKVKPSLPTVAGTRNVRAWRYRVTNLDLVPDEFWVLDEQKLAAHVRREKSNTAIPGIEVYSE